jgi:hypothetical protein
MRLERKRGKLVGASDRAMPELTPDVVRETLERTRR